ncbi:MAG: hypothetical protein IGBAC_0078 [Ignavibacteriae bacterium]|nr:MAG: hypothetical protein IGBAC_0078 [Ignavibacteriota bacterium]
MKKLLIFSWLILISQLGGFVLSQSDNFNLNAYKQFLLNNKNLTTSGLLEMYPARTFKAKISPISSTPLYLDSIILKYKLTDYEKSLIQNNGFMVSERLSRETFGGAFLEIWHKDLPVYISTDAILHAWHISFDAILKDIELSVLIPKLEQLLTNLHSQMNILNARYSNIPEMHPSLRDVDLYLTVARKLLQNTEVNPYYFENFATVNELMNLIQQEDVNDYPLFSTENRTIDFSQFRIRGHYADQDKPQLGRYFKSMIWLGRTEIYLLPPKSLNNISPENIRRQIIDAYLILEALENSNSYTLLQEIDNIIKFFVGESDNVTIENLKELKSSLNITNADELLNSFLIKRFQDLLKTKPYAFQRILSQILFKNPLNPDQIVPASAFLLLGQRFIVDSYITSEVVFDKIVYNGVSVRRILPSTLDIIFSIGNNAAAQLLQSELDNYHYAPNLAALRYLVDSYDSDFWNVSLYNLWLNSIRRLNPPNNRTNLPAFMQTAAFWQKMMNTQLASWSQLRHDVLLYAKQSYTRGIICSYPYSYVEPFPEFYNNLSTLSQLALDYFNQLNSLNGYAKSCILNYFQHFNGVANTLAIIAKKELDGIMLNQSEKDFLKNMLFRQAVCGRPYNGWYYNLYYTGDEDFEKKDLIVADVHTAPTNEFGNVVGWVLHSGTGMINLGVFVTELPSVGNVAFIGPMLSYHEYVTERFLRLSDEEWKTNYYFKSTRPSFVNLYLADSSGNSRGSGINLFTSANNGTIDLPQSFIVHQNYPNPFNTTTTISFNIPVELAFSNVDLSIYNIQGQLIKKILNATLPANTYFFQWNGTDENGKSIASGIYFYKLSLSSLRNEKMTNYNIYGKMVLIK